MESKCDKACTIGGPVTTHFASYGFKQMMATFEEPMGELFLMEQMNLKKGLEWFGKPGGC